MYKVPSSEEFREFLSRKGLTGSQAARLVGKEPRAIRRYAAPETQQGARSIQWDTWALLRILTGEATREQILDEIDFANLPTSTSLDNNP